MKTIDIATWKRKEQFDFFRHFDDPFFNITADIDVTKLIEFSKKSNFPFFLTSIYFCSKAANGVEEFKYRIKNDKIICHEIIHPGTTVLMDDNTFRYCYFDHTDDLKEFCVESGKKIKEIKKSKIFNPGGGRDDLYYHSVVPWVSFTGLQHAKKVIKDDSIPRIVFGKYYKTGKKYKMPVSVEVNHALMDGYHVGKFFENFQLLIKI